MQPVRTVGHGTLSADELVDVLTRAGVDAVVDVRRFPGSRRHPHFRREEMEAWLPRHGVEYRWLEALGGRRPAQAGSPNLALRNAQLRAYADHMASEEFDRGIEALRDVAGDGRVAVMCSESVWWRCHRRLLADHLVLVEGVGVEHVFHDGRITEHPPTPEARVAEGRVVYDVGGQAPLFDEGDAAG